MRWEELLGDLEAQAEAAAAADLADEVSDRTRRERASLLLLDRLRSAIGGTVAVDLPGAAGVRGLLRDVGPDWLLIEEDGRRELLVPAAALLGVTGLGPHAEPPHGAVAARLDLRWALRVLARDRAEVALLLTDGGTCTGTVDRVAADHLDLAEHQPGEPRRAVRSLRAVPLSALSAVRRA